MRMLMPSAGRMPLALFAFVLCSAAFADQEVLVTVDPNSFAPGQNISNATAGAQLLALTAVPNPDPNFPGTTVAQYLPVYAQPVAARCIWGIGIPCALGGNLALGYSPTTIPSTQAIFWGDANAALTCVTPPGFGCETNSPFPVLRVNFTVPTNYATAAIAYVGADPSLIEAFEAFDGGGQSIARCEALPPNYSNPTGCATIIIATSPFSTTGWALFTISRPTADISFVLIGGSTNSRAIANVQFNSPVSLQLAGLLTKVEGLEGLRRGGRLEFLEHKIMRAQTEYAEHDIEATCDKLIAFVDEVNEQNGKHIETLTASQMVMTALDIEAAIGCQ